MVRAGIQLCMKQPLKLLAPHEYSSGVLLAVAISGWNLPITVGLTCPLSVVHLLLFLASLGLLFDGKGLFGYRNEPAGAEPGDEYVVRFPKEHKGLILFLSRFMPLLFATSFLSSLAQMRLREQYDWEWLTFLPGLFLAVAFLTLPNRRVLRSEGKVVTLSENARTDAYQTLCLLPGLIGGQALRSDPTIDPRTLKPVSREKQDQEVAGC